MDASWHGCCIVRGIEWPGNVLQQGMRAWFDRDRLWHEQPFRTYASISQNGIQETH